MLDPHHWIYNQAAHPEVRNCQLGKVVGRWCLLGGVGLAGHP